jgi:hypothetical protein
MSKSLLNILVQISKVCQKSEFQIKFENVLFLELGPARVFGLAAWALAFGRPALPPPPHSSWASASWPGQPTPAPSPSPSSSRPSLPPSARAPVCRHAQPLQRSPPLLPKVDTVLAASPPPHQFSPHARTKRTE